ncbi:MAG: carboxypeptidase regulatory-like domain-containing protein, partial [Verrucomicrobiaceae bacterium]|nr:carboxypeptidase regulatory-like domain-containing protein [Verrucomicrobiaceae bacterium]
ENWLNAKLIHIPGYKPQLLGSDDASAEAGFIQRMEGLIAFSKQRAERCRADVEADRREPVEPIVLECALETARVTADLLHTLGVLAAQRTGDATLKGKVIAPKLDHPQLSRLPVKIVLRDTLYSTLTSEDGSFSFAPLPAGEYRPVISALGLVKELPSVKLSAGASVTLETVDLDAEADGNLMRNPDFKLRWVSAEGFDHWNSRMPSGRLGGPKPVREWEGEKIPLQAGITYRLSVRWKPDMPATEAPDVFVRTKAKPAHDSPPTDSAILTPGKTELTLTGSAEAAWAQVIVRMRGTPDEVLESVNLHAVP